METQGRIIVTTPEELSELIISAIRAAGAERSETESGPRKKLITAKDIEKEFGIHPKMLAYWRNEGIGPTFITFGRRVFYERPVFEEFVQSGRIQTTGHVDR